MKLKKENRYVLVHISAIGFISKIQNEITKFDSIKSNNPIQQAFS